MSAADDSVSRYVEDNHDTIVRVLCHGSEEARAHAYALLTNAGEERDVEEIKREIENYVSS